MIGLSPILAASDLPLPQPTRVPRLLASDMVLILGLAAVIFVLFIAYIVFIRGSKSDIQRPSRRTHQHDDDSSEDSNHDSSGGRHRKRKRVRRREHRQRNPTLSQAGGLPPPRGPEQSSSPLG